MFLQRRPDKNGLLSSDRGAKDTTLASIRRDLAFLCRKTTADLPQIDCNAYSKITADCRQIVSNFYLAAPHFLERRIGSHAENIGGRPASCSRAVSRLGKSVSKLCRICHP